MFELLDTVGQQAVIKVIGIGGGGGNAVEHMVTSHIDGVEFINANTDAQALNRSNVGTILQLGTNLTKGLGAGADPEVGRQAAMEDRDRISEVLDGADMVFITAGMGGGTGTGAASGSGTNRQGNGGIGSRGSDQAFPLRRKKTNADCRDGDGGVAGECRFPDYYSQ